MIAGHMRTAQPHIDPVYGDVIEPCKDRLAMLGDADGRVRAARRFQDGRQRNTPASQVVQMTHDLRVTEAEARLRARESVEQRLEVARALGDELQDALLDDPQSVA